MTAVFLEIAADVAYEEGPVEECCDEESDCGEGPDCDGEAHEREDYALEGREFLLVDVDVERKVLVFGDGI
jgi:hypothetical protein